MFHLRNPSCPLYNISLGQGAIRYSKYFQSKNSHAFAQKHASSFTFYSAAKHLIVREDIVTLRANSHIHLKLLKMCQSSLRLPTHTSPEIQWQLACNHDSTCDRLHLRYVCLDCVWLHSLLQECATFHMRYLSPLTVLREG